MKRDNDETTYRSKTRHRYAPRTRKGLPEIPIIAQDKAIQLYLARCAKPDGSISERTRHNAYLATYHYLKYTNSEITDHAISNLVNFKKTHPQDTSIEDNLTVFQTLRSVPTHRGYTSVILGIFHRNYARLDMSIHIASDHKTLPIFEPILRAIRHDSELTDVHRDAIDLMAFGAERFTALNTIDLKDIHLIENTQYAIFDIPAGLAKNGVNHPSIIPKRLAERLLQRAQKLGYPCPIPNYQSVWQTITELAKRKYNVKLTSHYFRKRFESIGETIPADKMNANHWVILMGEKPKVGHMPDIYSLMTNHEIMEEYHEHLAPRLSLTDTYELATIRSELEQLREQNKQLLAKVSELTEQTLKLTSLLTSRLTV